MTEKNRNPFAPKALPAQPFCTQLRHPFFDNAGPPSGLDCLAALNRAACMVELLDCIDLNDQTQGKLTPDAISGYRHLTEILRETFAYSNSRLTILNRKRQKKRRRQARKQARYLAGLSNSLATLDTRQTYPVRDDVGIAAHEIRYR